jgi:two-component system chemotaxis response regulator CheB
VKEAAPGDRLEPGLALVAPGGRHLLIRRTGEVALSDDPPVHGVRPAVDVTLHSLVEGFGPVTTAVILTGMGADGANGCVALKAAGGRVIAEDESSCVVYGMPRAVVERGAADLVLPLPRIAPTLARLLE